MCLAGCRLWIGTVFGVRLMTFHKCECTKKARSSKSKYFEKLSGVEVSNGYQKTDDCVNRE